MKRIENADNQLASLSAPKNLDASSPDNILIKQRKQFRMMCTALKTQGIAEPEKMTIFDFYSTIEYFENRKKNSKQQK